MNEWNETEDFLYTKANINIMNPDDFELVGSAGLK